MRRTIKQFPATLISTLVLMIACVEPYTPDESKSAGDFLVVDGFLNGTSGTANIQITRATALNAAIPVPPETGATVTVEPVSGPSFTLTEIDKGIYTADNISFDQTTAYRVHIATTRGANYSSDFVKLRESPSLDSISWRGTDTGLQFYVSSHDPNSQTTYYRYLFTETWEYRVTFVSDWKKSGGVPVFRDPINDQVYTCWRSTDSQDVLLASTKNLNEDVVSMFPIRFIPKGSRMVSRLYSMLLQQRAISKEEYEYWSLIKKTTETLGGLFDPLPSQVIGNIHNDDDPEEQVFGYFTGGYVKEQRIFLREADLPPNLHFVDPYEFQCETRQIPYNQPELSGSDVLLVTVGIPPTAWLVGTQNCSDCTTLGGRNVKPSYWPQ